MKVFKIVLFSTLFVFSAEQTLFAAGKLEIGLWGKCWNVVKGTPLAPGNAVANKISGLEIGGYLVGEKFQWWLPKVVVSVVTYYVALELIGLLRAKYKKMRHDQPKKQMIKAAVDQIIFLKEAQKKMIASKKEAVEKQASEKKQESVTSEDVGEK